MDGTEKKNRELLNDRTAAEYLGFNVQTLRNWRWLNKYGPVFVKFPNGSVRYDRTDLDNFIDRSRRGGQATESQG